MLRRLRAHARTGAHDARVPLRRRVARDERLGRRARGASREAAASLLGRPGITRRHRHGAPSSSSARMSRGYAATANEPIGAARGVRVQVAPPTRQDVDESPRHPPGLRSSLMPKAAGGHKLVTSQREGSSRYARARPMSAGHCHHEPVTMSTGAGRPRVQPRDWPSRTSVIALVIGRGDDRRAAPGTHRRHPAGRQGLET